MSECLITFLRKSFDNVETNPTILLPIRIPAIVKRYSWGTREQLTTRWLPFRIIFENVSRRRIACAQHIPRLQTFSYKITNAIPAITKF